jgi:hypothetical protein
MNLILIYKQFNTINNMEKKKCKQCGKSFEASRINSLYCSNTCKQKAHHKRSAEKQETIIDTEKPVFYVDEFSSICENGGIDFITYCFLRKNITETDEKLISSYIYSFVENGDMNLKDRFSYLKKSSAYKVFEEKYLSGEFTTMTKRESLK